MVVDFIDPAALVALVGEPGVRDIADEVRARVAMVRDTVAAWREAAASRQVTPLVTMVPPPDMPA